MRDPLCQVAARALVPQTMPVTEEARVAAVAVDDRPPLAAHDALGDALGPNHTAVADGDPRATLGAAPDPARVPAEQFDAAMAEPLTTF